MSRVQVCEHVCAHMGLPLQMDQPADCQREVLAALFRCFTGQQDPRGLTPQELVELLQYFEKGLPPEQVTSFLQFDVRVRFHPGAKNGEGTHTTPGGPPWPPSRLFITEENKICKLVTIWTRISSPAIWG